jgi:hypothetical protein
MRRVTISLPDDLVMAIERETRLRHTSVSAFAREAIEQRLGISATAPRDLPFVGVIDGDDGPSNIAEDLDTYLAARWGTGGQVDA